MLLPTENPAVIDPLVTKTKSKKDRRTNYLCGSPLFLKIIDSYINFLWVFNDISSFTFSKLSIKNTEAKATSPPTLFKL